MERTCILNLGAGKIRPLFMTEESFHPLFLVNLDRGTYIEDSPSEIMDWHRTFKKKELTDEKAFEEWYINEDAFEFMERYSIPFDHICMYRFLEHIPKEKVLYFIYLISTILKVGGTIDIIVPDYRTLAERIIGENPRDPDFDKEDIITTYELLNDPNNPHASIWTHDRLIHFFEFEGRFEVGDIDFNYEFDGRDIYLRCKVTRVK